MTIRLNDEFRALIMTAVASLFPVLQVLNIVDLTGDQVAIIMAFIGYTLTAVFYVFKSGQSPAVLPTVRVSIPADRELRYEHPDAKGGTCVSWVPEAWTGAPTRCACGALELVGATSAPG